MHGNIFIINVEELTCLILCKGILFYSTIKKLQEEEKDMIFIQLYIFDDKAKLWCHISTW